jgi:hypothetical protein
MIGTAHAGSIRLQEEGSAAGIQVPPAAASLTPVVAAAAALTDPTSALPSDEGTDPGHEHSPEPMLLLDLDALDNRALDPEQPTPYPRS